MSGRAFTALVNPISGRRTAERAWESVATLLREAGAEVDTVVTRSARHAAEASTLAAREGRVVVAVGGDGMVRDVAGGVVGEGTMAIVPGGRGNDFAHRLGVPDDTEGLASMLLTGRVRDIDVLEADGVVVPGNLYVGVDSRATRIINRLRRVPAIVAYRAGGPLAMLTWRPPSFTITLDDGTRVVRAHSVVAANSGWYGHGLKIVPSAEVDDGLIDVMVVSTDGLGRRHMAAYMNEAKSGRHVERAAVEVLRTTSLTLSADAPVPLCMDGDEIGTLPVTVRLRASALRVVVPA
ncbi:diacylglycerol/lipid kinase family protein [Mumia zhuanghuii]|uniref:Diacylglycerol kinase family lipid kinase n=1 Tax=Mumia zhuanghuii TaxID=2585211 RepID=A0A5C4MI08_9ACTN|nr:diacylglycerol kinase family protein [Mumia zhuanghuii]TNC40987.1 diacylglycerol kinase family lipid kinase [Mumia zhuanghuii]TNC49269.1 diacylglycerol kinase family lipid kinase [Mumia zhuanghuii]